MICHSPVLFIVFFFNDTATTEIYTLSLHDALPILAVANGEGFIKITGEVGTGKTLLCRKFLASLDDNRSEEHTSELQSQFHLVCRLLLEKKKNRFGKTALTPEGLMQRRVHYACRLA